MPDPITLPTIITAPRLRTDRVCILTWINTLEPGIGDIPLHHGPHQGCLDRAMQVSRLPPDDPFLQALRIHETPTAFTLRNATCEDCACCRRDSDGDGHDWLECDALPHVAALKNFPFAYARTACYLPCFWGTEFACTGALLSPDQDVSDANYAAFRAKYGEDAWRAVRESLEAIT